jgi:hypothetical protein
MKTCPFCAEQIQDAAIVCKHCNRELLAAQGAAGATGTQVASTSPVPHKKQRLWVWVVGVLALLWVVGRLSNGTGSAPSRATSIPAPPPKSAQPDRTTTPDDASNRESLWNRVSSEPPGGGLFSYFLQYPSDARSDMASAAIDCFTWQPMVPLFGNTPRQRLYIEELHSSDLIRRAEYARIVREHGKKAILFVPHLIPLLEDGTTLSMLSGPAIGPKTNVGRTTVRAHAHWALTGITSEDFGFDSQQWSDWWRTWWNAHRREFY